MSAVTAALASGLPAFTNALTDGNERTGFYVIISMICNKRLDCLTRLGLKLDFIKNDKRFSIYQLNAVNQLKSEENVIEIGDIIEKIMDLLGAFGEIY